MAWSNFHALKEDPIEQYVPHKRGVYIIRLTSGFFFKNTLEDRNNWKGLKKRSKQDSVKKDMDRSPFGINKTKTIVRSNLVYIGYSQNLQRRLLEHFTGEGSQAIKRFMKYKKDMLFFAFEENTSPRAREEELYEAYIKRSGGYCPPFDCGSSLCEDLNGAPSVGADLDHKGRTYSLCGG